jgi:hypothetical protein
MHSLVLSILFQVGFYAIMAFSAKASEARPHPHNPSKFMQGERFLAQRLMRCYAYSYPRGCQRIGPWHSGSI